MESLKIRAAAAVKALQRQSQEWRALLAAIRERADTATLAPLTEAALVGTTESVELRSSIRWAEGAAEIAARAPALTKQWDRLVADLAEVRREFTSAGTDAEKAELNKRAGHLGSEMDKLRADFIAATQAAHRIAGLRAEGVLE